MQEEEPFSTRDSSLDLCESEKKDVRRPMNAFLIFCKRHRSIVREKNPDLDNRSVTRILGGLWANLKDDEKCIYTDLAKQYKDAFMKANPDYKWHNPEKVQHSPNKPVVRPTNMRIVRNEMEFQTEGGITPGKLADPSNMGGLSLLLMAGQQTQTPTPTSMGNKREHSYVQEHPSLTVKQEVLSPVLPQSQRNAALLELAEMCSNELQCQTGGQKPKIPKDKTGGWSHDTDLAGVYHTSSKTQKLCPPLSEIPKSHPSQIEVLEQNPSLSASASQHLSTSANRHPYESRPANQLPVQSGPANQHPSHSGPTNLHSSCAGPPTQPPFLPSKSNQYPLSPMKVDQYSTETLDRKQPDHKNSFQHRSSLLEEALKDDQVPRAELKPAKMPNFTQADTNGSTHKPLVASNKNVVDCIIDKFFMSSVPEQQIPLNLVKKEAKLIENKCVELEAKHIGKEVKFIEKKDMETEQLVDTGTKRVEAAAANTDFETVDTKPNIMEITPHLNQIQPASNIQQKSLEELQVPVEKLVKEEATSEIDQKETPLKETKTEIDLNAENDVEESVAADQEGDYEIDYEEEPSDDFQPVRKSKRRNRGQRYKELINEGIIQPSKERLAAMRSEQTGTREESVSDDEEYRGLDNIIDQYPPIIRRARKRTNSETERMKPPLLGDDTKRYKTGDFDLEAHIATLPACSLENVSRNGRRACATKARHNSESSKKTLPRDGEITVDNSFCLPPHVKLKKTEGVSQNLVGSKKRKARKYSINRMLPMPEETKQGMRTARSVSTPSNIVEDQQIENDCTEKQINADKVETSALNEITNLCQSLPSKTGDQCQIKCDEPDKNSELVISSDSPTVSSSTEEIVVRNDSRLDKNKTGELSDRFGTPAVLYTCGEREKKDKSILSVPNASLTNQEEQVNRNIISKTISIETNNSRSKLGCAVSGDQSSVFSNESPSEHLAFSCLPSSRSKISGHRDVELENLDTDKPFTDSNNGDGDRDFTVGRTKDSIQHCKNAIPKTVRECENIIANKVQIKTSASAHERTEFDFNSNNMVDMNVTGDNRQLDYDGNAICDNNSDVQFVNQHKISDRIYDREKGNNACGHKLISQIDANDVSISLQPETNQSLAVPCCTDHCKLDISHHKCATNSGMKMETSINFKPDSSEKGKSYSKEPGSVLKQQCMKNVTQLLENNPELVLARGNSLMETIPAPNCLESEFNDESTAKSKISVCETVMNYANQDEHREDKNSNQDDKKVTNCDEPIEKPHSDTAMTPTGGAEYEGDSTPLLDFS